MEKESIALWFQGLQDSICHDLEQADGKARFQEDQWQRKGGGGGKTRVIQNGNLLAKGGVNFSAVFGEASEQMLKMMKIETDKPIDFFATGVSIVLHPINPMMPIIHKNIRYFEMTNGMWWFGGGIDLTPHYIDKADAKWFHQQLKAVCDAHHSLFYTEYKKWADDYFFLKHRNETRGVGGIFFDYLNDKKGYSKEQIFDFVKSVGLSFAPIYTHFMEKNANLPYGESELAWQGVRRGRYVEFNLVWDRGTKFGLETDGRTESILMSLPPEANWLYSYEPTEGSKEAETQSLLKKEIDWLNIKID
ncbi:MAG: oxygen-dependent coproporphyrinogen oxidase [Cytophagales bacterium]|nr:MAG: oxygen-dependent coproporphyrinogen oxidase [Cytophagales bacterium]